MTLSEILDTVQLECGLSTYDAYAEAADEAVKRLLYFANRSISNLSRYPWQALRKTYTFTLTDDTSYTLPGDYRALIQDTMYTDSHLWPVDFPANEAEWAYLQASSGGTGPQVRVRLLGNTLNIYEPTAGETIRVEYLSNTPVIASDNTRKEKFTADTDSPVLDSDLVTQDIIWRYKKLLGMDFTPDLAEFKSLERILRGQEAGAQTIRPHQPEGDSPYYNLWRPSSEAV